MKTTKANQLHHLYKKKYSTKHFGIRYFMLVCIAAILQIAFYTNVLAQTDTKEVNFDSLVKANDLYLKQDLTKLKMLNQLVKGYSDENPAKGIEISDKSIELAQKLSNKLLLAEAYNNKGLNHTAKGEYPIALELFEKALDINQKLKNTFGMAENTFNIGNLYRQNNENQKAIEQFEKTIKLYESIKNLKGMADAYNKLGFIYLVASDYNKAIEYLKKTFSLNEQLGDKKNMAGNLHNIGSAYTSISNYSMALDYYNRAKLINEEVGNKNWLARNLIGIGNVYELMSDYQKAKELNEKALAINDQLGDRSIKSACYGNLGRIYKSLSDYPKAIEYMQKSLGIDEQLNNKSGMAIEMGGIGSIYSSIGDYPKALEYHLKAYKINEDSGNERGMGICLGNIGNVYKKLNDNTKALEYYLKCLTIIEQIGTKSNLITVLGNIGSVYTDFEDYLKAFEYHNRALMISEELGDKDQMATNLANIGSIIARAPDSVLVKIGVEPEQRYSKALENQFKSLDLATEIGTLDLQKAVWSNLNNTYEQQGDFAKAYDAYKKYIVLRDSIESDEIKDQIERKTMQYEFDKKETAFKFEQQLTQEKLIQSRQEAALSKQALALSNKEKDLQRLAFLQTQAELHEQEILSDKQIALNQKKDAELQLLSKAKDLNETELELSKAEVQSKNQQRNGFILGSLLLFFLAGAIFIGLRKTAKEKKKSEDLLLNILPAEIANELKNDGESMARQYNNVSVLFTDFVNFTGISEKLSPTELVQEIHKNFTAFDAIMEKHGIEKIKTIGDAYLAVCGLPHEVPDHAQRITKAALEIQEYVRNNSGKFKMRIGINSGPVVAGIVGVKKFAYDIWGDTVNTASRMESESEAGKVNISETTYDLIKDLPGFSFESRGKVVVKGKGEMAMWFVSVNKLE